MDNHKGWDWGLGRWCLLGTLVVVVLVLGTLGWLEADPDLQGPDALYRAIQLFVLDMPEQNPPPALNVARWLALIVAFYAVAEVLRTVFTQQKQLLDARLRTNHVVVIGNGPEAASLAGNDTYHKAGKQVVVIGDLAPSDQAWLTGRGVSVLPDLSDPHLTRVLRGAKDVVIVGGDDDETANLVCRVASTAPKTQPLALFDSPNPTGSRLVETPWEELSEFNKSSNRAVVLDYPVKLASIGLDWRRSTAPTPAPALELTDEQKSTLSVAEHRRWSHFQRRNGREGHYFNTPWDELTTGQQSLDENIINTMGSFLASEDIEIIQGVAD